MSRTERLAIAEMLNTENMSRFLFLNERRLMNKNSVEHKTLLKDFNRDNLPMDEAKNKFVILLKNNSIRFTMVDNGFETVPLILDKHALSRASIRAWFVDIEAEIPPFLTPDAFEQLMDTEVEWDNGLVAANGGELTAVAIVKEGEPIIPVFESGCFALNIRTILAKNDQTRRNFFQHGTRVIYVDKNGETLATEDFIQDRESINDRPWHRYPNIDQKISDIAFR